MHRATDGLQQHKHRLDRSWQRSSSVLLLSRLASVVVVLCEWECNTQQDSGFPPHKLADGRGIRILSNANRNETSVIRFRVHDACEIYYYSQRYPFPRKKEGKKQCKTASPAMCYIPPLECSFSIFPAVCSALPALLVLVLLHQRPPRIHFGRCSA